MKKYYAIYSKQQAELAGEVLYSNAKGEEVLVTEVGGSPDFYKNKTFNDIIYIGEVRGFIKRVSDGIFPIRQYEYLSPSI